MRCPPRPPAPTTVPPLRALVLALAACCAIASPAGATTYLTGTVTRDGAPVANAAITADGDNVVVTAVTDARGRFSIPDLGLGTYTVTAVAAGSSASSQIDVGNAGATLRIELDRLKSIGSVTVARSPASQGSGSDTTLGSTFLVRSPSADSFSEALVQLPGAVRGANGVVHLDGDHGIIDYTLDGVALPQALNRELGNEINPNDISFVDVVEGAYPAQYGLRFGSVLNISSRSGTGPPGFLGNVEYGSYNTLDQTLGYHAPLAHGGGYEIATSNSRTTRALDPPDGGSPFDAGSDTNQFARFTLPSGKDGFTDLTLIHSFRTYQIPNDVAYGEPAGTDDNESQEDSFVNLQFRRALGSTGSVSFGPAVKVARIRDFGDPAGDWAYGKALDVAAPPFGNGGAANDCAAAVTTGSFSPTTCAVSLEDDKTSIDAILQTDYVQRFGRHEVRAGAGYDLTRVVKRYEVSLQPDNFLAGPVLASHACPSPLIPVCPASPASPVTVVDDNPNVANTSTSYVQDSWRASSAYELDAGLRYDAFGIASTDFRRGFGGFSPRIKLTRFLGARASVYGYLGRFFEPFSSENVDPYAAQLLNLPLQASVAQFDLEPERATQLELGGHVAVGAGELGFRAWQKNANDLIDDAQLGVTLLHQDINYYLGRISAQTLDYVVPTRGGGRVYANVSHGLSDDKGCATQLLAPCFASPSEYTPADHEQRYSVTGGLLLNDRRGGWVSGNLEYGSGLSSGICAPADDDCKTAPHTIVAIEKGIAVGPERALTLRVSNLFNDRYYVTLLNAQGNHYAPPRGFALGLRFGR